MQEGRPSATAFSVALLRAVHQTVDGASVFRDPYARPILGPGAGVQLARAEAEAATGPRVRLRATVAVRSRIADEAVAEAQARGIDQIVLLGAGLDTTALRVSGLRVYEVDHPATQAWKRRSLAAAGLQPPPHLQFVPVDFERQDLAEELARAGFRAAEPAVFLMLGVTPYVALPALMRSFATVAAGPAGTELVFDYGEPWEDAPAPVRAAYAAMAERAAASGEPWVTAFRPSELTTALRGMGFTRIEDLDTAALAARYFADSATLRPGPLAHVVRARR